MTENRSRIRLIAFWVITFVIVFELAAGSVWNLLTIEWVEIQLRHLEYPDYFAYVLGAWQAAAAVAITAPGFPVLKEWAYVGIFFLWSGAVVSHLITGDGVLAWGPPLMFAALAVASWVLRPADRRLPETRRRRDRAELPAVRPRAWTVAAAVLAGVYAVSFLTLSTAEETMKEVAVDLGWTDDTGDKVEVLELDVKNDQYGAVDLGAPGPSVGDLDAYSGTAIRDGRTVGHGGGACQVTRVDGADITMQCVLTMRLERGSVTMQALWVRGANPLDMAVTGGTGAYREARGTVRFWDIATPQERARAEIVR